MIAIVGSHDIRCPGAVLGDLIEHFESIKINNLVVNFLTSIIHISSDAAPGGRGPNCASWTLSWKVRTINALNPDLVIETHLNAFKD